LFTPVSISNDTFKDLIRRLASKQAALILFSLLGLSLVPGTFAETDFHVSVPSRIIIGCIGVNLLLCTARRLKNLPLPVLVMHVGALLIIAGATVSAFGFVATVNIYEGATTDTAYRWDLEEDRRMDVAITVKGIKTEFYPVPVRVGVLKGRDKVGLFELKTGGSFTIDGYRIKAEALMMPLSILKLSVFQGDRQLGTADTEGAGELPQDFPYAFRLVAFGNPVYKQVAVELALTQGPQVVAEGIVEANSPLVWNGLYYYHTQLEWDKYGKAYAGIQIVKDPGKPFVYMGFAVLAMGSVLWAYKIFYGRRRIRSPANAE
jgi:hypothetical protein